VVMVRVPLWMHQRLRALRAVREARERVMLTFQACI
jgi:hypothetical protein